jgi:trigger factor
VSTFRTITVHKQSWQARTGPNDHFWDDVMAGWWEPETYDLLDRFLSPEESYLDLGAWIGATVLYAAGTARRVYAVDADPVALEEFNANVADHGEVTFTVLVKEVRETVLPEVTDEWASEASEFETVAELREDIFRRTDAIKRLQASLAVRDKVIEALVELVDEDMPEALVRSEMARRVENLQHRLSHQNATLADYLQATGQNEEQLAATVQAEAIVALKADLALQAVADIEGIEVSDEELDAHIESLAERRNEKPNALRRRLQSEGELPAVRSGLRKTKALEWLVEHTEYVDEDGRPIDRSELEPRLPEAPPGDESPTDNAAPAEETS